jgi:hypothetical protein
VRRRTGRRGGPRARSGRVRAESAAADRERGAGECGRRAPRRTASVEREGRRGGPRATETGAARQGLRLRGFELDERAGEGAEAGV